jgi:hypothetical protein
MATLLKKASILLAVVAILALGSPVAIAQVTKGPQQAEDAFRGIHRNLAVNGGSETVGRKDL